MGTLVQPKNWRAWIENGAMWESMALAPDTSSEVEVESRDKTDRLFHFPARPGTAGQVKEGSSPPAVDSNAARTRWLEEHDIRTEFLDAGIGCCWFAQQGDHEPVMGETEEEAIARLVQQTGLLWRAA